VIVPRRRIAEPAERLRELVFTQELQPGEQVRQEEMSRLLGISRVSLREALLILTAEKLLTHRPHQGYFVTKVDSGFLDQVYSILDFVETELLRTARWPSETELASLRGLNAQMVAAQAARDVHVITWCNNELHAQIYGLSPLDLLEAERRRLWTMSEPYRRVHASRINGDLAAAQHDELIDALRQRDRERALAIMARHRRDSHSAVLRVFADGHPFII
jgi:DNA-binding GntR family transcriptional regulator